MIRLWKIVFLGQPNSEHAEHAHENGLVITMPLMLLAVLSVIGGFAGLYPESLASIPRVGYQLMDTAHVAATYGMVAWAVGLALAFVIYGAGAKEDRFQKLSGPLYTVFEKKFYFDEIYGFYVAKIQQRVASILGFFDELAIGGLAVRGLAGVAGLIGFGLKALHVGNLHQYVYWFIGGLAFFWALAAGIF